ncbi:hypothetical protein ACQP3L_28950, partial [Escherichia coli]
HFLMKNISQVIEWIVIVIILLNQRILRILCWLVLCQLDTNENHLGRGNPVQKMFLLDWLLGKPMVHFLD